MLFPDLKLVKKLRIKNSLTQYQLALVSDVSQSLIAKIEAGSIEPSYDSVKKIFTTLEKIKMKKEVKLSSVMHGKIVTAKPNDSVKATIKKLRAHAISQLPVVSNEKPVGLVTESELLDVLMNNRSCKISDVMRDPPPILASSASISVALSLLRYYPLILVSKSGKLTGVVTKSDVLSHL